MADPSCGNQEYGAAAAGAANYVPIAPRYSDLNFSSATAGPLQNNNIGLVSPHHDYAEFSDLIAELFDPDELNLGNLQPLSPLPTTLDEILSSGSDQPRRSASSSTSMPTHFLQESTVCHVRPQVYERSPSCTFFVAPPPPPIKVVQLQCLQAPAHVNKHSHPAWNTQSLDQLDSKYATDFAFQLPHNADYPLFGKLDTAVTSKASPYSCMPPASTMGLHNNQNDYALNIMAERPNLIQSLETLMGPSPVKSLEHPSFHALPAMNGAAASPTSMESNRGAFSDSAAMEFSSAAAAIVSTSPASSSASSYHTSMLNFGGMNLSAPVSPTPSVNYTGAALHESFNQISVEDFGSGNQLFGSISGEPHQCKGAWRTAQGGIHKRRKHSRRTCLCVPYALPNSVCDNVAATLRISTNDVEARNSTHLQDLSEVIIRVKTQNLSLHDGYVWRKYGKKTIKNDTHTRNYMRCEESKRSGCSVLKRTQRCSLDEEYVDFRYLGKHNHPL